MTSDLVERNRAGQRELYGEPLGDLFGRLGDVLGLTQSRLANVVGLSAPMLSQLISGQRAKIGNPAVVQRVQALVELSEEVRTRGLDPGDLEVRLAEIKGVTGAFTQTAGQNTGARQLMSDPRAGSRVLQGVLRAVASAEELSEAARRLDKDFPAIAEVLRVYGTGRTDDALQHFDRVQHLL